MSHNIKSIINKLACCISLTGLLKGHRNWLWLVIMGSLFVTTGAQAGTVAYIPNPDNYSVSVIDTQTNIRMAVLLTGDQTYITDPWLAGVAINKGTASYLAPLDNSGDGSSITINFDVYPNNAQVAEGTIITDQYADAGVIFGIADSSFGDAGTVIEDASAGADIFTGMSVPNMLTFHGYVPGSGWSLGCNTDLKISFIDPLTKQSAKVQSGSIRIFATARNPLSPIKLVARNAEGLVIDQNEFLVSSLPIVDSFILSVAAGSSSIATIETLGSTGNDVCLGFDNLVVSKPINEQPVAGDITIVSSGELVNWIPQVSDAISGPQPLACRIASQPVNGIATVAADCANGTYQPNPGFVGTDSFTYVANDGVLDSNPGTVTVGVGTATSADDFPAALSNYVYGGWQGPYGDGTAGRLFPTADGTGIYMDATYNGYVWARRAAPEFTDIDMTMRFTMPHRDNTDADAFALEILYHNPSTPPSGTCIGSADCLYVEALSGLKLHYRIGNNQLYVNLFANGVQTPITQVTVPSITLNQPHQARVTYAAGKLVLYLDGVQLLDTPTPNVPAGQIGFEAYRVDLIVDSITLVTTPPVRILVSPLSISGPSGEAILWQPVVTSSIPTPLPICVIKTLPTNGMATVASDCSTGSYRSHPGFIGTDSFVYEASVCPDQCYRGSATVTVAVTEPPPTDACVAQYPVTPISHTGKEGTLTITFTGNITSHTNKEVKVCPGTALKYITTSTQGPVVCKVKNNTTRGSGSLKINDNLKCTDKPAGKDKVHFKVKSGVGK